MFVALENSSATEAATQKNGVLGRQTCHAAWWTDLPSPLACGNDNAEAMGEARWDAAMASLSTGALRQLHWVAWVLEPKWIQI